MKLFRIACCLPLLVALSSCGPKPQTDVQPLAITRDTACSLDGMVLTEHAEYVVV